MKNCLETVSDTWTTYQRANLFNQLQTLTDIIQKKQNKGNSFLYLFFQKLNFKTTY